MRNRTPRLLAVLLAGTLVLGACGDDDSDDAADPDETTTSVTTEEDAADDDAADDDAADEGTDGLTEDDEADDGGGSFDPSVLAGIDDFCDLDDADDEGLDALFDSDDPEDRRAGYEAFRAFFVRAMQIAPSEIQGDVEVMARGMEPVLDLLEDFDYDFMAIYAAAESDPEVAARLEAMEDPEVEAASDRVDAWIEANCD